MRIIKFKRDSFIKKELILIQQGNLYTNLFKNIAAKFVSMQDVFQKPSNIFN